MEFIEYYRTIRERIWLVLLTTGALAVMVVLYQLMPQTTYEAQGSLRVDEGANQFAVQRGDEVAITSSKLFWDTLIGIGESRDLVERAAARLGITGPDLGRQLKEFDLERPTRSNVIQFTAWADDPNKAVKLARAGMDELIDYWRGARVATAETVRKNIEEHLQEAEKELQAAEDALARFETTAGGGAPVEELAALQQELVAVTSQIASAQAEVALAQDRAAAVRRMAKEESGKAFYEQSMAALPEVAALQRQKDDLELQLAAMLEKKTPEHPDVKALKAQIADLEARLRERKRQRSGEDMPLAYREQLLNAELDARAARGKIASLQARQRQIQEEIPRLREKAKQYQDLAQKVEEARAYRDKLLEQKRKVEAEISRLNKAQDIQILDQPQLAPSPKTAGRFLLLLVAAITMGLVLGSMAALLSRYVDVTVRNEADVEQMLGERVLAVIPRYEEVVGPPRDLEEAAADREDLKEEDAGEEDTEE